MGVFILDPIALVYVFIGLALYLLGAPGPLAALIVLSLFGAQVRRNLRRQRRERDQGSE